jgi:hypothetical protein
MSFRVQADWTKMASSHKRQANSTGMPPNPKVDNAEEEKLKI